MWAAEGITRHVWFDVYFSSSKTSKAVLFHVCVCVYDVCVCVCVCVLFECSLAKAIKTANHLSLSVVLATAQSTSVCT